MFCETFKSIYVRGFFLFDLTKGGKFSGFGPLCTIRNRQQSVTDWGICPLDEGPLLSKVPPSKCNKLLEIYLPEFDENTEFWVMFF